MSDQYEIQEEKPSHHYRFELPNCLTEMQLNPLAFRLYCQIKRVAGENGKCWKTLASLGKDCEMSESSVKRSLEILESGNNKFNLPLIRKTGRLKEDGSKDTCVLTILDIWDFNGSLYKKSKAQSGTIQPDIKGGGFCENPPLGSDRTEGGFPKNYKEEHLKKNTKKKQQPPEEIPQIAAAQVVVFSCLEKLNIPDALKKKVSTENSQEDVQKAVKRCLNWKSRPSDGAGLMTALKLKESWSDNLSKEDILTKNLKYLEYLKDWDQTLVGVTRIDVLSKGVQFIRGPISECFSVDEPDFCSKVKQYYDECKRKK